MAPIIHVQGLTKEFKVPIGKGQKLPRLFKTMLKPEYRTVKALNGISFDIEAGEFVGYLGANGAGKSTSLKCLTGILYPTAGEVRINGYVPWIDRMKYTNEIGAVFGEKKLLMRDLPVKDSFTLYRSIYRLSAQDFKTSRDQLVERFQVAHLLDVPARKLSLGERMRCELIAAILHKPKLLFLDEPSIGLDFNARRQFREMLKTAHKDWDITVVLTSHELVEVEALSSRIIVLSQGNIVYDGSIAQLRAADTNNQRVEIDYESILDATTLEQVYKQWTPQINQDGTLEFVIPRPQIPKILAAISLGLNITGVRIHEPPLDTLLGKWYKS
jgi:ABC-2 type transport system ATP-binding protein